MTTGLFLGIETSGESTALALICGDTTLGEAAAHTPAKQNEVIFDLLTGLFESAGAGRDQLAGIGVSIGPGMFTSLRVGLSVAKGIALAHKVPIKGINSLDALVLTARAGRTTHDAQRTTIPLIDARRGEVFGACYEGSQRMQEPLLLRPEAAAEFTAGPAVLCGSGVKPYRAVLETAFGPRAEFLDLDYPSPVVLATEAAREISAGRADRFDLLAPLYLRATDAELRRAASQPAAT